MKTKILSVFALILIATGAGAEGPQGEGAEKAVAAPPVAGLNEAELARGARASRLIGSKVYTGDTSIGTIEDVLVDLDTAQVSAVILSVGGFLGMGDKLIAVPANQLKVGSEARFATDLTKEQLSSAPTFDYGRLK